jgi:hypothetical protein
MIEFINEALGLAVATILIGMVVVVFFAVTITVMSWALGVLGFWGVFAILGITLLVVFTGIGYNE